MAYIDLTKVTDRHAQDIITEDSSLADLALDNAEVDTRVMCRGKEVKAEDIPLDTNNYLQSEMVYNYCKYRFLYHLFLSVAGTFELDDIYSRKSMDYQHQSQLLKDRISKDIITEEEVTQPANRNTEIPIL